MGPLPVSARAGSDGQPGAAPREGETAHEHEHDADHGACTDARVRPVESVAAHGDELSRLRLDEARAVEPGLVVRPPGLSADQALNAVGLDLALDLAQVRGRADGRRPARLSIMAMALRITSCSCSRGK